MLKYLWISVLVIVFDQITKYIASTQLDYAVSVSVIPMFNFTLLHNTGAAFSFLSDAGGWQRWFFVVLALTISVVLFVWLLRLKPNEKWLAISLSLILGGALGNVIDRSLFGYVIDFLDIYYNNWHWPAFNIADSAITVGAVVLILEGVFKKEEKT
jgi:signal peptidase II